ncbi:hypothetical protein GTO89_07835 [Heliobacterium gestii]|uniref:Uncharacterized protein n=1 Tax=Heliomicrobium gestii TaxID=2699 RepID=A0A845LJ96_HELGE|nr:hypothetical protein [Heliomicrobium gestii]MBM7866258.1 hypothetical protein [Heliomicrobium gestii]MZP42946.1 hypothetical protein [Heliomicrobium gestii]
MAYGVTVDKKPMSREEMLRQAQALHRDLVRKRSAAGITTAELERDVKEVFEEIKSSRRSGRN